MMNKLLMLGATAGALCISGTSEAQQIFSFQPHANFAVYGSYMDQNDRQAGVDPGGGGVGGQLGLSLTPNIFIGGSYQYNYLTESHGPGSAIGVGSGPVSYGERVDQGRVGGGLVFPVPGAPVNVFGKIEYVHYDYQIVHAEGGGASFGNDDRVNDDGVGFHAGAQTRFPGFSVYGSVGYLQLDNSRGPEINVGFELPVAPLTWGFIEYRYDDLHYNNAAFFDRTEMDDVRAGVRMTF
jgi:hypothetical protein